MDIWIWMVTGFLSSLHCIGMCGPIVIGYVTTKPIQIQFSNGTTEPVARSFAFIPQLYYHLGRVISYSMLGAFAGMAGAAIAISPSVHQSAGIVFGSFMILFALYQLGWLDRLISRKGSNRNSGILSKVLSSVNGSQKPEARLLMGLFTPLLPCGLLYAMLAAAAITHSPLHGAISMAGFAVGAMPGLMFAGTLSGFLSARMRKFGTHFAIVIIILMGLLTIGRGIGIYNGSLFDGLHDETTCGEQIQQKE